MNQLPGERRNMKHANDNDSCITIITQAISEMEAEQGKSLSADEINLAELERLIQTVYEDKVLNRVPEEVCISLLNKYQEEKIKLQSEISGWEREISESKQDKADVEEFIRRIKRYVDVQELTREMCLELIEFITIDKFVERKAPREIHIYYKLIDKTPKPQLKSIKSN